MKAKTGRVHFGWVIFLTMSLNLFCLYDVTYNSLFVLPLASALGVTRGTVLVFATCYSASGIFISALFGSLLSNKKVPLWTLMAGGVLVQELSYLLFAFGNSVEMIYLAGFLMGVPVQGCTVIMPTVFASNWYATRQRGKLLSIQNSIRGLGGIVWPLLVQLAISTSGYRAGYIVLMIAAVPCLIMGFVVRARTPDEMGLQPLGYREDDSNEPLLKKMDNVNIGWNLRHAMKTAAFWLMIITVMAFGMENGFASNFSGIAEECLAGYDWLDPALVAAGMLAWRSAGNMCGNLTVGFVVDLIGPRKTTVIWLFIFSMFFVIVLLFGGSDIALYVAGFCFGFNSSILRNPIPMAVRDLFGARYFGTIWGVINAVKPMVSGIAATSIGISYDFTNSYLGSLLFGLAMAFATLIFFIASTHFINRYDYENHPDLEDALLLNKRG